MNEAETKSKENIESQAILMTRIIDATPDAVFDAWIQPWRAMKWFSPKDFTSPFFAIDLRVGGICRHCMRSPEKKDFWSQGVFREIRKPYRLVYTDSFCDEKGNIVSPQQYGLEDWPDETLITVTFDDYAGGTKLTLQHSPAKPSKERDMCQRGWDECLDKLTDYFKKGAKDMKLATKTIMKTVAINRFGGIETLAANTPIPEIGPDEILIHVESAGVGEWDPFEREGGFAKLFGVEARFPYILGTDGAGTVEAVGSSGKKFKVGDRVYAFSLMNPKGGFYAEYTVVKEDDASLIPENLTTEQAGVMPVDAITALRGLDDTLHIKPGESILIFGASGGIGHLAVQLAKRMDARVLAVASGKDGVELVKQLGADKVIDGHRDDIIAAVRDFAPNGLDTVLLTAGGNLADKILTTLRQGGRVAFPNGVEPEPKAPEGVTVQSYDGRPDSQAFEKLNRLIEAGPFVVHIVQTFPLDRAADAQRALKEHHLGKIALRP